MYVLKYLWYILEHKWNVFKIAWKKGLYLHAFTHDLSKFSIAEFLPYAKYFYLDKNNPEYKKKFKIAWEHHYKNNPHHWQFWQGKPMPIKYIKQMICDWEAMSLKFGDTPQTFYLKNYENISLHKDSRILLENFLGLHDKHKEQGT